jgi:hypothetical protein
MQYGYFDDGAKEVVITRPFVYKPLIGTSPNRIAGQLARIAKNLNPGIKKASRLYDYRRGWRSTQTLESKRSQRTL